MRWLVIAAAVGVAWALLRSREPAWYRDLVLRAYAADQIPLPGAPLEPAAAVALELDLPIAWVQQLGQADAVALDLAARRVKAAVLAAPPVDTSPATLAAYKSAALAAGGVA